MSLSVEDLGTLARLFDRLWEIPEGDRGAWIEALPAHLEHLKAPLHEWVAQQTDGRDSGSFGTLPKFTVRGFDPAAEASDSGITAGAKVAGYRLLRELGRGGMSTVWLAQRIDAELKREVALKLPFLHLPLPDLELRFARERDILAGLNHPNIARLYDAGVTADGQPFLVMEYVDGVPLTDFCNRQALTITQRLTLFGQVIDAVRYAHSRLVLHRDLKPSNILVNQDGRVSLLDFGIAKLVVEGAQAEVTRLGGRALTLAYASPEQISGLHLSTASDVYSLGVILFELLTGESPYKIKTNSASALEEAILRTEAPKLTAAVRADQAALMATSPERLTKSLRGDLDAIVHKALQKSPSRRYGSVESLAQDLAAYLEGNPVSARPDSRAYVIGKFLARHKAAVGAASTALLAIVAGAVIAILSAHIAVEQRDRALALASRNRAVTEFLGILIEESAEADKPLTVKEMLERSESLASGEKNFNPDHRAAVLEMLAEQYHTLELDAKAQQLSERALELAKGINDNELQAAVRCTNAEAIAALGDRVKGRKIIDEVLASGTAGMREAAHCTLLASYIAVELRQAPESLRLAQAALAEIRAVADRSQATEANYVVAVATGYQLTHRYEEADASFRDALQRFKDVGRDASPDAISARNNWGSMLNEQGSPARALEIFDAAIDALARHNSGALIPGYLLANRAKSFESMGMFREAVPANEQCVLSARRAGNLTGVAYCTLGLATDHLNLGEVDQAQGDLDAATQVLKSTPDMMRSNLDFQRLIAARIAVERGRFSEARKLFDEIDASDRSGYLRGSALAGRSQAYFRDGKLDEALRDAKEGLALKQRQTTRHSSMAGRWWLLIAQIDAARGDAGQAREDARMALEQFSDTVLPASPWFEQASELRAEPATR